MCRATCTGREQRRDQKLSDISLEEAQAVVDACLAESRNINTAMNIAVVDAGERNRPPAVLQKA